MSVCKEKLSMLSEMIAMARIDGAVKMEEYNFLSQIATQLGVTKNTFNSLFFRDVEKVVPKSKTDRILQFHRLALLMNVGQEQHDNKLGELHVMGLGLGLRPSAILKVISEMDNYPDKQIPRKRLLEIFDASEVDGQAAKD